MIRQTPSGRLRVVAVAVAGAGMLATAALAATSTAPNGSYGKLPGYGGHGRSTASGSDYGSGGSPGGSTYSVSGSRPPAPPTLHGPIDRVDRLARRRRT